MERKANVCGILSIVLAGVSFIVCWWLSIVAMVLGIVGLCISGTEKVTSAVGLPLGIVSLIVNILVLGALGIL